MFKFLEFFESIIYPISIIYLSSIIFILVKNHIRNDRLHKKLIFTKENVAEKKREINLLIERISALEQDEKHSQVYEKRCNDIVKVLLLYNELAAGINEGFYDETYIRITLEYDMIDFYKKYYSQIHRYCRHHEKWDITTNYRVFMPLELLLKKWDK